MRYPDPWDMLNLDDDELEAFGLDESRINQDDDYEPHHDSDKPEAD